ncbi:unnamed protein product [Phytomonas sp. EM1]|nr:unnamed protein product [Phytomonas sp. EM1]|eukprot:CCW63510.1 unnamed protein product [Phytomonas sp. isolate EM1]
MSLFLQKLKSGGVSIDNNAPPDSAGVIVRKLEKNYVNEPLENLGLTLSDDAEVLLVAPSSPAGISNIPTNYMLFEVNNEFIESKAHFEEVANRNLNLVMRLQSLATMSDLIAKILREEETHSKEEVRQILNLDELVRTTPRYNFMSNKHPLFRRYTERLAAKRQATELIKQRTQEAEEQQRRKLRERMRKELEASEAEAQQQAKAELEKASKQVEAAPKEPPPEEPFLKSFEDGSFFEKNDAPVEVVEEKNEPDAEMSPEYASELLALIGVSEGTKEETMQCSSDREAHYVILPSEEYILSNGERVICSLKKRTGPLPLPPPGKPPRINKFAKKLQTEKEKNKLSVPEDNKRESRRDSARDGNRSTTREKDKSGGRSQREKDHGKRRRERPRDRRRRQHRRYDDSQEKSSRHHRR